MSDSLIEKMIENGVNINNFQEVFNFFHSIDAIFSDLIGIVKPELTGIAQDVVKDLLQDKVDKADVELALFQKLNRDEYNNHFKGLYKSYIALTQANIDAVDGDYAHIDGGISFGRMAAIWDGDDEKWVINEVQVSLNTDEMPEGSKNLYFQQERVKNTVLMGLSDQNPTKIVPTDSIIVALSKLQAQLKKIAPPTWVDASEVFKRLDPNIEYSVNVLGKPAKLQFLKVNGLLYVRGGFRMKVESASGVLGELKDEYKIKYAVSPLVIMQVVILLRMGSTLDNQLYISTSSPIDKLVDASTVKQEVVSSRSLAPAIHHTFGCFGALLD